jgi:hypothetical protein
MDVLADIKLVNAQQRTLLRAAMKQADPPLQAPSRGYVLPLNFNPGAMNYRDSKTTADALQALPVVAGKIPLTMEVISGVQHNIENGFFVPLFRSISEITKQMTVPEVQRRIAEAMVLLGPVVGRFTQDVLGPLILRVFYILYRRGEIPEPPEAIQGQEMSIIYLSNLAKAQRESEMYSIESFLGSVGSIAQVKPSALDLVDEDKAIEVISKIKGVNPEILRSPEQVASIRKARAQAQEAQAKMNAMAQVAAVGKDAAAAEKTTKEAVNVGAD